MVDSDRNHRPGTEEAVCRTGSLRSAIAHLYHFSRNSCSLDVPVFRGQSGRKIVWLDDVEGAAGGGIVLTFQRQWWSSPPEREWDFYGGSLPTEPSHSS